MSHGEREALTGDHHRREPILVLLVIHHNQHEDRVEQPVLEFDVLPNPKVDAKGSVAIMVRSEALKNLDQEAWKKLGFGVVYALMVMEFLNLMLAAMGSNFPMRIFDWKDSPFFFAASFSLQNRTNKRTTPGGVGQRPSDA
ncbi:unnamed protein product [Prunus armeniaca]